MATLCLLAALVASLCPLAALSPAVAQAASVSSGRMRALASRAAGGDTPALERLRTVTAVDGRPSSLADLLAAGTATQVRARLVVLARSDPGAAVSAGGAQAMASAGRARAMAAAILAQAPYGKPTRPPDPVVSALDALGKALTSLATRTPGGPVAFWAVAAALVLVLGGLGARRALRRLGPAQPRPGVQAAAAGEDPAALEREAHAAQEAGAFEEAVRLRFRAGLLKLGARSAIDYRPSLLTAEVARGLRSEQFDSLNDTFERIAYGGAPGRPADAEASRQGWTAVLAQAGERR